MPSEIVTRVSENQPKEMVFCRSVAIESWKDKERTFDVVASTGSRGIRSGMFGRYEEELEISENALDLSRANNYAPFIDSHGVNSVTGVLAKAYLGIIPNEMVIGQIVPKSARIENSQVKMTIRVFTEDKLSEEGKRTVKKIADGDLRHVSIDYTVGKWERIRAKDRPEDNGMDLYRGIEWKIIGLSAVYAGFDDAAMTRSETVPPTMTQDMLDQVRAEVGRLLETITQTKETNMPKDPQATTKPDERNEPQPTPPESGNASANDIKQAEARAKKEERERIATIESRGEQLRIDAEQIRSFIDDGTDAAEAIKQMLDTHAERAEKEIDVNSSFDVNAHISINRDEKETRAKGIIGSLVCRMTNMNPEQLQERLQTSINNMQPMEARNMVRSIDFSPEDLRIAGEYLGYTMLETGQMLQRDVGVQHGGRDRDAIARDMISLQTRANPGHSVSDYPLLFQDALHVSLIVLGEEEVLTFEPIARIVPANDFRTRHAVKLGGSARWKRTPFGKGYDFDTGKKEEGENYIVEPWSSGIIITRQMIVDDDLGVVQALLQDNAIDVKIIQNDVVWNEIILANLAMSDGNKLCSAAHKNVAGSASAPSMDSYAVMYDKMGAQVGPGKKASDRRALNLVPHAVAMPRTGDYLLKAHQIQYGELQAAEVAKTVPKSFFKHMLPPIAESRIPSNKWFGFASPGRAPVIEIAYLNGQRTPNVEQLEASRMEGIKYGAWLDFGASAVDWRGVFYNGAIS